MQIGSFYTLRLTSFCANILIMCLQYAYTPKIHQEEATWSAESSDWSDAQSCAVGAVSPRSLVAHSEPHAAPTERLEACEQRSVISGCWSLKLTLVTT